MPPLPILTACGRGLLKSKSRAALLLSLFWLLVVVLAVVFYFHDRRNTRYITAVHVLPPFNCCAFLLSCTASHAPHACMVSLHTCAPALAASATAFSAVAVLTALSSPHRIWHAATITFDVGTMFEDPSAALIELTPLEYRLRLASFPRLLRAVPVLVAVVRGCCLRCWCCCWCCAGRSGTWDGMQNASAACVVGVLQTRRAVALILLAAVNNIHVADSLPRWLYVP